MDYVYNVKKEKGQKEVEVKHRSLTIVLLIAIILAFSSCTTVRVSRLNENKKIDLSGDWNDTDISLVSERLIRSCLKGSWFSAFTKAKKADPVVIVGRFSNMSSERIDTSIITKRFEAALVESQKVIMVSGGEDREFARDERMSQQIYANPSTAKEIAMETGADFMLFGSVKTVTDTQGSRTVRTYYVSAELVDLETTRIVWLDETTIKKEISRSAYTW